MEFLKKPLVTIGGFAVTPLIVVAAVLVFVVFFKKG